MSKHLKADIERRIKAFERRHSELSAERNILSDQRQTELKRIGSKDETRLHLDQTVSLLVQTADTARNAGKQRMEKVVTRALQSIFGPDFQFDIELGEVGGRPVAEYFVITPGPNGTTVRNKPQDSRGGGINDIVAFAIQVANLVVYNSPKIQGCILLDEPGKHVSEDHIVKFGEFIDFINKTFGRQIIYVTHQAHLAQTADTLFQSQMIGGTSRFTKIDPIATIVPEPDEENTDDESEIEWID